jgi:hypothetical protein
VQNLRQTNFVGDVAIGLPPITSAVFLKILTHLSLCKKSKETEKEEFRFDNNNYKEQHLQSDYLKIFTLS